VIIASQSKLEQKLDCLKNLAVLIIGKLKGEINTSTRDGKKIDSIEMAVKSFVESSLASQQEISLAVNGNNHVGRPSSRSFHASLKNSLFALNLSKITDKPSDVLKRGKNN